MRSAYRSLLPEAGPHRGSTFHTYELRPGWVPSRPRGRRCSHGWLRISSRRLPHPSGNVPTPRCCFHRPRLNVTRHHRGFTCVHPSGLPLACSPRMEQGPLGFSPELRTPPLPATHVRVGTGLEHWPGTTQSTSSVDPPFCESTRYVRPRVALLERCSAPERIRPAAPTTPAAERGSACCSAGAGGLPRLLLLLRPYRHEWGTPSAHPRRNPNRIQPVKSGSVDPSAPGSGPPTLYRSRPGEYNDW